LQVAPSGYRRHAARLRDPALRCARARAQRDDGLMAWFNHHRLLEPIGYIPPAEAEANYYRQLAEQADSTACT